MTRPGERPAQGEATPSKSNSQPAEWSCELPTPEATTQFGRNLSGLLRAGDLVLLHGELGAGKTTLTRGIGEGLAVRGTIASPTFIIARTHRPAEKGRPGLVHVDAYRLSSLDDLETLDLDTSLEDSVTVVEWGGGLAEVLSDDRLEITIERPHGAGSQEQAGRSGEAFLIDDGVRHLRLQAFGPRWDGIDLGGVMVP